jgi:hypothetical protein
VKILSVDAETNGLYGQPFVVGAVCTLYDAADVYLARCPIDGPVNPWVADNVLPALADVPESQPDYPALLADFARWYDDHIDGADVIAHCGVPVEARLFADLIHVLGRDPFSGPFPLHDVATLILLGGYDPTSAEVYMRGNGLRVPAAAEGMSAHNPLYDAIVADVVWRHGRVALAAR